jgi:hypothetical protein
MVLDNPFAQLTVIGRDLSVTVKYLRKHISEQLFETFSTPFMLFAFYVQRPETSEDQGARRRISYLESAVFCSTAPTPDYLAEVLERIDRVGPTLRVTKGLSGRYPSVVRWRALQFAEVARVVQWLQTNRHLSPREIRAKYPILMDAAKRADDPELGVMFDPLLIHHGRLGSEIDKVFGLDGSSEPEEIDTLQSITGYSIQE